MRRYITLIVAVLLMSACAHSLKDTDPDLVVADKKCTLQANQEWPSATVKMNCFDTVETPIIKRDAPILSESFEAFSSKRKRLAQEYDNENASAVQALSRFRQGLKEAIAELVAQEPKWGDKNSLLNKDILSANPDAACISQISVDRVKCYDSIMRPIWKRDVPDTIERYDEFQKKRLQLAKEYDAAGAPQITAVAVDHFQKSFKDAMNEFQLNARRSIQDAEAKKQISNESGDSALKVLGQIVEVVAVVAVVVGAVAVGVLAAKNNHGSGAGTANMSQPDSYQGCCSWHEGLNTQPYCNVYVHRVMCGDNQPSPTCGC